MSLFLFCAFTYCSDIAVINVFFHFLLPRVPEKTVGSPGNALSINLCGPKYFVYQYSYSIYSHMKTFGNSSLTFHKKDNSGTVFIFRNS